MPKLKQQKSEEMPSLAGDGADIQQPQQHVVRIRRVPYGFFEKELHGYFMQFGAVQRVRVLRNKKGNHNGIAFVEFKDGAVAKIAAQTMDNYLLAENRLRCKLLAPEELPKCIQKGKCFVKFPKPGENRIKHATEHSAQRSPEKEKRRVERFVGALRKRMAKVREMGIDYEFDFETKFNAFLASQSATVVCDK